jgi:hypothetical protein
MLQKRCQLTKGVIEMKMSDEEIHVLRKVLENQQPGDYIIPGIHMTLNLALKLLDAPDNVLQSEFSILDFLLDVREALQYQKRNIVKLDMIKEIVKDNR